VENATMNLHADEKELLESVERGEWKPGGAARANSLLPEGCINSAFFSDHLGTA